MASTSIPYPGLRRFRQDEHLLFFGRFDHTAALYRLLNRGRFLAVIGGSGSGKSSLVHAGLLPLLAGETNPQGAERWLIVALRPGVHPVNRLAAALCEAARTATDPLERVAAGLRRTSGGLADEVGRLFPVDREVLILIDQFEELFRYADAASGDLLPSSDRSAVQAAQEDEARRFVDDLLTASSVAQRRIRVVLTMRSDFIGDCARFPGLAEAVSGNQYLTPRLDRDQLTEAIVGPLLRVSGRLDPDVRELPGLEPDEWADLIEPLLVEQLKNDAGNNPDQLPVLQHALLRCWQTAGDARLNLDRYRYLGGWGKVLSGHADEVKQRCGPARGEVVERVFRALTELERGDRAIRRALTMTQLVAETGDPDPDVRAVVAEFSAPDCSFLVPPMPPDELVDIGHEALIRNWSILKESWIEAERRDRDRWRTLLELTESADPIGKTLIDWWNTRQPNAAWAARWSGRPAEADLKRVAAHVARSEDDLRRGPLDEAEVEHWLRSLAEARAAHRKALLGKSSTVEEMEDDWDKAGIFFALDVIEGKVNFVNRIAPESYYVLEQIWLEDVKQLLAYLIWQDRPDRNCPGDSGHDYFLATEFIRTLLVNKGIKSHAEEFTPVRDYIEQRYLTDGRLDTYLNGAHELVRLKAFRIFKVTRCMDNYKNWEAAASYTKLFYENIITAAVLSDKQATLGVLKAFQFSKAPENHYDIISAFETALAVYFLEPDIIQELWDESASKPLPQTVGTSSVKIAWPLEFVVPDSCLSAFFYTEHEVFFRGVMSEFQRRELAKGLSPAELRALNELFESSRLIHRETTL